MSQMCFCSFSQSESRKTNAFCFREALEPVLYFDARPGTRVFWAMFPVEVQCGIARNMPSVEAYLYPAGDSLEYQVRHSSPDAICEADRCLVVNDWP